MALSVGIVGGGMLGCLVALDLARRGHDATIFERRGELLEGASRRNEGKVHLGFTYGLDDSGATRSLLFDHGSRFEALLADILGRAVSRTVLARRLHYLVHRGSSLAPDGVAAHMAAMAELFDDPDAAVRKLSRLDVRQRYGDDVEDVYDVAEVSVDCEALCGLVREAVLSTPRIRVQCGVSVARLDDDAQVRAVEGSVLGRFDRAVNAAWDGMPAIERRSGAMNHPLCLRGKAGFVTDITGGELNAPITIVYGSYGDAVPLTGGRAYISWYPAGLMGLTTDLSGGSDWYDAVERDFDFAACYRESVRAISSFVPGLTFSPAWAETRAGAILAAGASDISDPRSGLHRRTLIGIYRRGKILAVDTGKLTSAPALAREVADRIAE